MNALARRAISIGALAALVAACSFGSAGDVDEQLTTYGLFPSVAHSGHNPQGSFRVLFATSAPNPTWAVADGSIATIASANAPRGAEKGVRDLSYALATMTKAGETTVTVKSGETTLTSKLVVKGYSDADVAAGKVRYETGGPEPNRVACASCHAKPDGVDHSPLKMAGFDDPVILGVIQEATYPPSTTGRAVASDYAPKGPLEFKEHKWSLTDQEKVGILAHLRSLPLGGL
jgi:hypothetical protein